MLRLIQLITGLQRPVNSGIKYFSVTSVQTDESRLLGPKYHVQQSAYFACCSATCPDDSLSVNLEATSSSTGRVPWLCPQKRVEVCFELMMLPPATHADCTSAERFFIFLPSYSNRHSLVFYHKANLSSNSVDEKINYDCCTRLVQFCLIHLHMRKEDRKFSLTWT